MTPTTAADFSSAPTGPPTQRCSVVIEDRAMIPAFVEDLASFRRWAHSDSFPEQGQFAYLNGELWVDLSMEELLTHNRVKTAYTFAVVSVLQEASLGDFVSDRMRLSNPPANLSVEPDGLFYTWQTLQSGRLRYVEGIRGGIMELEGSPDMALEIVSDSSVRKDTVRLRELYWRAEVSESWLVDVRGETMRFEILRHTPKGYVATESADGWQTSIVLGKNFRLLRSQDPLGRAQFRVEVSVAQQA
jgi:Uma2 family endonuclease